MSTVRQQLLETIAEMWELYPDWRLGQLVINGAMWARQPTEPIDPTWDVEDEELLNGLRGHIERRRRMLAEDASANANQTATTK
jgi:hypothetical protein